MIYFYALIANGANKKQIPKSFINALNTLLELNMLDDFGTSYKLKPTFVIGSIDVSQKGLFFVKSFNNAHQNDFRLMDISKHSRLKKGDIVLAKIKKLKGKGKGVLHLAKVLYATKPYTLGVLVEKKGAIKALELDSKAQKEHYITLKASQKSLRAMPKHCVLKIDMNNGEIVEVLGVLADAHIDEKIALSPYNRPLNFSQKARDFAFGDEVCKQMYPHREDLTHLPFCVIDPQDARDHDDGIYFDNKNRILYVAIADVSEYVNAKSELDKEARARGFSLYFPHKVLPMLPFELSSGICSLKAQKTRLAMVWAISLDKHAQVLHSKLFEALICSHANVSYEQVEAFLNKTEPKTSPIPLVVKKWLKSYVPYVKKCKAARLKNGYEFSSQEIHLELDSKGEIASWKKIEQNLAHSIIEESMLLANVQSAHMLNEHIQKGIFRIHPPPKEERIKELMCELRRMGFTTPKSAKLHKIIASIQHSAHKSDMKEVIDSLIIKSFAKATYSVKNMGHFGLGFECYTHFTSPIRRYSDLVVHRILKAFLHKSNTLNFLLEGLYAIAQEINVKEKQISFIEQDFYQRKMIRHTQKLLESSTPLICQALVINEVSHALALDSIPHVRILLPCEFARFELIEVVITQVDLLRGIVYGKPLHYEEYKAKDKPAKKTHKKSPKRDKKTKPLTESRRKKRAKDV